jgi:hypothetical protein
MALVSTAGGFGIVFAFCFCSLFWWIGVGVGVGVGGLLWGPFVFLVWTRGFLVEVCDFWGFLPLDMESEGVFVIFMISCCFCFLLRLVELVTSLPCAMGGAFDSVTV